jgi:hypothetical protein
MNAFAFVTDDVGFFFLCACIFLVSSTMNTGRTPFFWKLWSLLVKACRYFSLDQFMVDFWPQFGACVMAYCNCNL